ncbi:hypothetical protein TMRO357_01151 [Alteriqipengyuania sp. 357]
MTRTLIGLSAAALMLAGCGSSEETAKPEASEAAGPQGEVRGGSITDAMLPVAMVQSQSPQRGGETEDGDAEEDGEEDNGEGDAG